MNIKDNLHAGGLSVLVHRVPDMDDHYHHDVKHHMQTSDTDQLPPRLATERENIRQDSR